MRVGRRNYLPNALLLLRQMHLDFSPLSGSGVLSNNSSAMATHIIVLVRLCAIYVDYFRPRFCTLALAFHPVKCPRLQWYKTDTV